MIFNVKNKINESEAALLTKVGYALENGELFEQDYRAAAACYELAARNGDAQALNNLGWLYMKGFGVNADTEQALSLFHGAAEAGNTTAMVNLGNFYEERGTTAAGNQALYWYMQAAEAGDQKGLFNLANCYHYGTGTEKDYKAAFEIFADLYKDAYPGTAFYLGLYYENGYAVKQDYDQARKYYRIGAMADDMYCYNQLGVMYAQGLGVQKDVHAAIDYYRAAAELGDALAYTNIGWLYESGELGNKDLANAMKYYELAAQDNEPYAIEQLQRLRSTMAEPEIDYLADYDDHEIYILYRRRKKNGCNVYEKLSMREPAWRENDDAVRSFFFGSDSSTTSRAEAHTFEEKVKAYYGVEKLWEKE